MDKQNIMGSLGDLTVETIPATAPLLLNLNFTLFTNTSIIPPTFKSYSFKLNPSFCNSASISVISDLLFSISLI